MSDDPRVMAHPAPDPTQPADSASRDMKAVAWAITVLLVIAFLASVVPAVPR